MKFPAVIAATLLFITGAHAQSAQQSGPVTPNTAAIWGGTGIIKGGVTATDSPLTTFGVTRDAVDAFCISSDRSTAVGRNQLCFQAATNGPAKISLQNYGTAAAQSLQFSINGVVQGFPTISSLPVVAGNNVCFNNTSGALKDCGVSPTSSGVSVGQSPIAGGVTTRVLYDNAGLIGEYVTNGSGSVVQLPLSATTYKASGLDTTASGSITSGTSVLNLTGTWDIAVGQGVSIPGAGPPNTAAVPTPGAVTVACTASCVNTLTYKFAARDSTGAYSAASSGAVATSSAAAGSLIYNRSATLNNTNTVAFTCGANSIDVIVYRNNVPVAIVPCADASFTDYGQGALATRDISAIPPVAAGAGPLVATVSAISGTAVTLGTTLAGSSSGTVTVYHDDGAALQTMLTAGCGTASNRMLITQGTYNTHQQLSCTGSNGQGMWLAGEGGTSRGGSGGVQVNYYGRGDQAAFYTVGLNGSSITDIHFNGRFFAKHAVQIDNPATNASSGVYFDRTWFSYVNSATMSAPLAYGHPSCGSVQISELFVNNSYFYGSDTAGSARAGFEVFCTGNTKNVMFTNTTINSVKYGVESIAGTSGIWSFKNTITGNVADTLFQNVGGQLDVHAVEAENYAGSLLARIVGSSNACFANFKSVVWTTAPPVAADFVIDGTNCSVGLIGNTFGGAGGTAEYKINVGYFLEPPTATTASLFSSGNWFQGSAIQPFFVNANKVTDLTQFPNSGGRVLKPLPLASIGDYGGTAGALTQFKELNLWGGTRIIDQALVRQSLTNGNPNVASTSFLDIYGGGAHVIAWADPVAPTVVVNTTGTTTYTYKIAFRDGSGARTTLLSAQTQVTNGAATPNNTISFPFGSVPIGAYYMDVIDVGAGNKLIGTVNTTQFNGTGTWLFTDTNQTRAAYTVPVRNTTGDMVVDSQVQAAGALVLNGDSYISRDALSTFSFGTGVNTRNGSLEAGNYFIGNGASGALSASGLTLTRSGTASIGWAATNATGAPDTALWSDAANTVAQRNGISPQELRVYNTWTDVNNGEWFRMLWSTNTAYLTTQANGTGVLRHLQVSAGANLYLGAGGPAAQSWFINSIGNSFLAVTDNATDIGAAGANRPRNLFLAGALTAGGSITSGAGVAVGGALTGATTGAFSGAVSMAGLTATATAITSATANALSAGPAGTTNPSLNVDASTLSAATGLNIKSAAAAGGIALSALSSGLNENLTLNAKGTGTLSLNNSATGNTIIGTAVNITSAGAISGATTGGFSGAVATGPLSVTGLSTLTGHIASAGTAVTAAAGANAGTTPPVPVVGAGSTDTKGAITFGTGTIPAAGAEAVVTFAAAYASAPVVVLTAGNAATQALGLYVTSTTAGFTISATAAPAASQANTTYSVNYQVVQ